MTSPNAAKGKKWELAVVRFLEARFGRRARRPHQEGFKDVGDVHLSPFVLQAKDEARHTFSSYVADAEKQALHAEEDFGLAVVKRRGVGTDRAYVVTSFATFRRIAARLLSAEAALFRADPEAFDRHLSEQKRESA